MSGYKKYTSSPSQVVSKGIEKIVIKTKIYAGENLSRNKFSFDFLRDRDKVTYNYNDAARLVFDGGKDKVVEVSDEELKTKRHTLIDTLGLTPFECAVRKHDVASLRESNAKKNGEGDKINPTFVDSLSQLYWCSPALSGVGVKEYAHVDEVLAQKRIVRQVIVNMGRYRIIFSFVGTISLAQAILYVDMYMSCPISTRDAVNLVQSMDVFPDTTVEGLVTNADALGCANKIKELVMHGGRRGRTLEVVLYP